MAIVIHETGIENITNSELLRKIGRIEKLMATENIRLFGRDSDFAKSEKPAKIIVKIVEKDDPIRREIRVKVTPQCIYIRGVGYIEDGKSEEWFVNALDASIPLSNIGSCWETYEKEDVFFMYWGTVDGDPIQVENKDIGVIKNWCEHDCNRGTNVSLTSILTVKEGKCYNNDGKYLYDYKYDMGK